MKDQRLSKQSFPSKIGHTFSLLGQTVLPASRPMPGAGLLLSAYFRSCVSAGQPCAPGG